MSLRLSLIVVSAIAVIADSMLLPFYPQYFATRFGETSPAHVGAYLAAICVAVMAALPVWARLARGRHPLKLLILTQPLAGALCVACWFVGSLAAFWIVSLAMVACKASYLLMYPYVMGLEGDRDRAHTIGTLSVVVHFGAILGAVLGGLALEALEPRDIFLFMAAGDLVQTAIVRRLVKNGAPAEAPAVATAPKDPAHATAVLRLCLVMAFFYFSAWLTRPFFTVWWQRVSALDGAAATGLIFAIPGIVALAALAANKWRADRGKPPVGAGMWSASALGFAGLAMQGAPDESLIVIGRCLFGWAAFQLTVGLDAKLFAMSTPRDYAADFAKANFAQNLGVVAASFAAGLLVDGFGLAAPFLVAAFGFALTAIVHRAAVERPERLAAAIGRPS